MHDVLSRPIVDRPTRLSYGADPSQHGDLRLPPGAGPHPLVIALHGGFWRARYDLVHLGHLCAALTAAGFATFSVEYRRVGQPGGGVPGTLDDALAGARFALGLPSVDAARGVLLGHSAGGQLALWAAKGVAVQGVVALAAVSDLARASELRLGDGIVDDFLGDAPGAVELASPCARLPLGRRQRLVHGDQDDTVPFELSERYVARARRLGDDAELIALPGAGHFEPIDPLSSAWPAVLSAVRDLVPP